MIIWLKRLALVAAVCTLFVGGIAIYWPDKLAALIHDSGPAGQNASHKDTTPEAATKDTSSLPLVSVATVETRELSAELLVTGTIVPRDEVLVAPQVEGQRIVALLAEEAQTVAKGELLARLVSENIDAQLAQSAASIARAEAEIAQAESNIVQAEARFKEAQLAYDRALPLSRQGHMATSAIDTRESAMITARAAVSTARDGLLLARANKTLAQAQRREIEWRRDNTEVRAPAAGIISRRTAKVGALASGQSDPLFRIVADGEVELDAEVPEVDLATVRVGQSAVVTAVGDVNRTASVRLVSPEIDRTTRLGRVRLFIGEMGVLKVGGFAKAKITLSEKRTLALVASAVMYDAEGPYVLAVHDGRTQQKRIKIGISSGPFVEVQRGLEQGDVIVARAGTFLRNGDAVRTIPPLTKSNVSLGANPQADSRTTTGAIR